MNRPWQRIAGLIAGGGAALLLLGLAGYAAGARINTSKSIPIGLYWTSKDPVTKGVYVQFCPPPTRLFTEAKARGYLGAGFCPGGFGYLMKRVVAVENEVIDIAGEGVRVNGELLPFSAPLKADLGGRLLPRYQVTHFILGSTELLLMSDVSATSFDGRYFGPVGRGQIKTVIRPLVTWQVD